MRVANPLSPPQLVSHPPLSPVLTGASLPHLPIAFPPPPPKRLFCHSGLGSQWDLAPEPSPSCLPSMSGGARSAYGSALQSTLEGLATLESPGTCGLEGPGPPPRLSARPWSLRHLLGCCRCHRLLLHPVSPGAGSSGLPVFLEGWIQGQGKTHIVRGKDCKHPHLFEYGHRVKGKKHTPKNKKPVK